MANISVKVANNKLGVPRVWTTTPYHPDFPPRARNIGGKWNGSGWYFDVRDEDRVRQLVRSIYGTDGSAYVPTADVRIAIADFMPTGNCGRIYDDQFYMFGRQVLRRYHRDVAVALGDGVIVIEGDFERSAGSRTNPAIGNVLGVVLEIRDVPASLLEGVRDLVTVVREENAQ